MRLPESHKKELLTIWYAATLTPRAKRLSKREIASIDVTNICNIMLDDTKDPITFPVIAALLLGAAKVLQQQSLMIYSDVLHLWSRLRPKLFEPKATDSIDLTHSIAKIKNITLTELEIIASDNDYTSLMETHYPFANLFDWTYVSPPLPSISNTIIVNCSGSIDSNDMRSVDMNQQPLLQPQDDDDYLDYDDYSFEEQFNRMNSNYLMSHVFLEGEHYDHNQCNNIPHEDTQLVYNENENEQSSINNQQQHDYSIPDLLINEYQDNEEYDNNDLMTAIMNDQQRRLFHDTSFSSIHQVNDNSRLSLDQQQQHQLAQVNDVNHDDDYYEEDNGVTTPISHLQAILSQPSTLATEDISGLIPLTSESSSQSTTYEDNNDDHEYIDENETFEPLTTIQRRRRRRRRHTTTNYLMSDSTTIVPASFYQQQESLVNRINPNQIFSVLNTTNYQKKKTTKKAHIEKKMNAINQFIHRPLVSVTNEYNAMNATLTSSEIELERARQNQQANYDDIASIPSSMDDILLGNPLSSGTDHQRLHMSRERSDSSESLLLESSDDEEQRKRLLSRNRIAPEFSRVPEDDYYDDYMDYNSGGHEDEIVSDHQHDGTTKTLFYDGDANDFLSYAQWKITQAREESGIALETLLSPIAHRSEVAQTFYYLLVWASRNRLRLQQVTTLGTIQIYLGAGMNMVNASTTTHSSVEQETE
ncbi:hypothetical protein INT45_013045 [Circinella minor]|uniref:Rad21/Rec8-like protein N-terminal domain-containing protein n=1 Tax=Circinella minor TaxID=1195481 RepID=A0A8H7S1B5_9FUNG|nr:hypothetical protein INT45_013045 [Circinella minor]